MPYYRDLRIFTQTQWTIMTQEHWVRPGATTNRDASLSIVQGSEVGYVLPMPAGYDYKAPLLSTLFPGLNALDIFRAPGQAPPALTFPAMGARQPIVGATPSQPPAGSLPPFQASTQPSRVTKDPDSDEGKMDEQTSDRSAESADDNPARPEQAQEDPPRRRYNTRTPQEKKSYVEDNSEDVLDSAHEDLGVEAAVQDTEVEETEVVQDREDATGTFHHRDDIDWDFNPEARQRRMEGRYYDSVRREWLFADGSKAPMPERDDTFADGAPASAVINASWMSFGRQT